MEKTTLSTKFLMPKPRNGYIVRKRLFQQLDKITDKRLTIIKGMAGSGKTTLLTSYIVHSKLKARWITLDSECNYIAMFWDYVVEALTDLVDKSPCDIATLLKAGVKQNFKETLKALINSIDQTKKIVLVLDDFHKIDNIILLQSFAYFLANMPPNIHIVLLSRKKPEIYLAGFELQANLLYLDEKDLSFTDEESIQFLKQTLCLSLPEEKRLTLIHKAGGWIGALQLLAFSKTWKSIEELSPSLRDKTMLHEYISNEIYNQLTPEERKFLVFTSAASYFNQNIAESLLPDITYDLMIFGLLKKNLMIQCIDEKQGLFQYHNLFHDYLLTHFNKLDHELKKQVYRKLSGVFHELGNEDESLRYLYLLEDYDLVMNKILKLPINATYYSYMVKLPIDEAVKNFEFAFQKFFYHYYIYDYDKCNLLYHKAMQYISKDERYQVFAGFPQLYGSETFTINDNLISTQSIRDMDIYPVTKAMILTKNAAFLFYQDRYIEALDSVNESLAYEKKSTVTYINYFNLTLKTQICEEMGLLKRALAVQEQAHRLIDKSKMLRHLHTPTFLLTIAGLYMKQMCLEKVGQIFKECELMIAKRGGQLQYSYDYNRIEYLFLTGDIEEAVRLLEGLMETEIYEDILMLSSLLKYMCHAEIMTVAIQNKFMSAYDNKPKDARSLNSRLLYARILSMRGKRKAAIVELDEVLHIARKQESHLKIVEATLQRISVMIHYSHDLRLIVDLYKEALYYACENNILLPFFMEANVASFLHRQYGYKLFKELSKQENAFHQQVVKQYVKKDNCILSEREQEVICLMARGLSNADIAGKLFITIPTIKTHISNIFRKLETKNRLEAVTKARQIGLI